MKTQKLIRSETITKSIVNYACEKCGQEFEDDYYGCQSHEKNHAIEHIKTKTIGNLQLFMLKSMDDYNALYDRHYCDWGRLTPECFRIGWYALEGLDDTREDGLTTLIHISNLIQDTDEKIDKLCELSNALKELSREV